MGNAMPQVPGHLLVHGEQHLQHILTEYTRHYNHYPARHETKDPRRPGAAGPST